MNDPLFDPEEKNFEDKESDFPEKLGILFFMLAWILLMFIYGFAVRF